MMDLMLWFLLALFVFVTWRVTQAAKEMAASEKTIMQALVNKVVIIRLEQNDLGVFAYGLRDGEFLAHGLTYEDMVQNFKLRFPNKTGIIVGKPGEEKEI